MLFTLTSCAFMVGNYTTRKADIAVGFFRYSSNNS